MADRVELSRTQQSGTRVVTWRSPGSADNRAMSGAAYLSSLVSGELPNLPFAELMNMTATAVSSGEVQFTCKPDESMFNAIGMVHGGVASMLVDTVASAAVWSTLPTGKSVVSIELKVNYLRSVHPAAGPLVATGRTQKVGSRVGFAEAKVTDAAGDIVATGTSTLLIVDAS
jgi:uncharacterized protein (TIGR00369 family)